MPPTEFYCKLQDAHYQFCPFSRCFDLNHTVGRADTDVRFLLDLPIVKYIYTLYNGLESFTNYFHLFYTMEISLLQEKMLFDWKSWVIDIMAGGFIYYLSPLRMDQQQKTMNIQIMPKFSQPISKYYHPLYKGILYHLGYLFNHRMVYSRHDGIWISNRIPMEVYSSTSNTQTTQDLPSIVQPQAK